METSIRILVKAKNEKRGVLIANSRVRLNGWTKNVLGKVIEILNDCTTDRLDFPAPNAPHQPTPLRRIIYLMYSRTASDAACRTVDCADSGRDYLVCSDL